MVQCPNLSRLGTLVVITLLCGAMVFCAQTNSTPTRIEVRPRGPAVTLEGDVEKSTEKLFVFKAPAGLTFSGHLTTKSGKAGFAVNDADGNGLPEEEFDFNTDLTGTLEKSGDYKISIATFDARRVHFTLIVRVY